MIRETIPQPSPTPESEKIKWTLYLACAYAECFGEGENATEREQLEAWAFLIETGAVWTLQGWYGRTAADLINRGIISKNGKLLV